MSSLVSLIPVSEGSGRVMAVVQEEGRKLLRTWPQGLKEMSECLFTPLQHRLAGKMREW